jgi:hypothetical protein
MNRGLVLLAALLIGIALIVLVMLGLAQLVGGFT